MSGPVGHSAHIPDERWALKHSRDAQKHLANESRAGPTCAGVECMRRVAGALSSPILSSVAVLKGAPEGTNSGFHGDHPLVPLRDANSSHPQPIRPL